MPTAFDVRFDGRTTAALLYPGERAAEGTRRSALTLVLAHGAGAGQRHPFLVRIANALAARGIDVVTFDFAYMHAKRKSPDPNDVLEGCWRAVLAAARARPELAQRRLFIGGKSMGGRIASQVAAQSSEGVAGLVFLGYPLHPPGKPEQLRTKHLPAVAIPMLFVQGSRDAFGTPAELAPVLASLGPRARIHVVDGGDHSFAVPKKTGKTTAHIEEEILDVVVRWMSETGERAP